jgi:hypothetical protein
MFSALMNAQNKINTIPITSVTWSIGGNTSVAYDGTTRSVTVSSVLPAGATYTTSTTTAIDAGQVASTTITGTGIYTGSFTSPTITITKGTPSVAVSPQGYQDNNSGFYYISVAVFPGSAQSVGIGYSDNYGGFISDLTGTYTRVSGYDSIPGGNTVNWNSNETVNWLPTSGSVSLASIPPPPPPPPPPPDGGGGRGGGGGGVIPIE